MREEDVPAEQPEAEEEARLPDPYADARRARRDCASSVQGPRPPVRLIWRVRDRAAFRALAAGSRRRRGALVVTRAPLTCGGPPQVAYAVGRRAGGAVARNRLRRRLRAVVRDEAAHLEPSCAYLVGAAPAALDLPYADLRTTFRAILADFRPREVA
jgi:ribonuclease P protein component